jgi:outer membrane receptor protein involved in Fe transport
MPEVTQPAPVTLDPSGVVPGHPIKTPPLMPKFEKAGGRGWPGFGQQSISGNAGFSFLETAVPGATSATSGSSFASFLLGLADTGATETVRYLPQIYDYHAFYVQDDWHVTKSLTLNLGLRYELTRPPYQPQQEYEDFSPTLPNPAVNGYPGALIFVGSGPGRVGSKYLSPGFYGGWGPRLGLAYGVNPKTTIRAGAARTFARSTVVSGTTHYDGCRP